MINLDSIYHKISSLLLNFNNINKYQLIEFRKYYYKTEYVIKKTIKIDLLIFINIVQRGNVTNYQFMKSKIKNLVMQKKGVCKFVIEKNNCYSISRKTIFKFSFDKFIFALENVQVPKIDTCDYFNYGFNRETMQIYIKLIKKYIQYENNRMQAKEYDALSWNLLKLNDQLPIDLGGFSPFLNKCEIDIPFIENFQKGDNLLEYFVQICVMINFENFKLTTSEKKQGITEFIRSMYRKNTLQQNYFAKVVDQIQKNIEHRYNQMMKQHKIQSQILKLTNKEEKQTIQQDSLNHNNIKNIIGKDQYSKKQFVQQQLSKKYCPKKLLYDNNKQKNIFKSKKVRKNKRKQKKHKGGIKKMNKRYENMKNYRK